MATASLRRRASSFARMLDVRAGRLLGDEQRLGDLAVREAPGQQAEHLTLTPGQAARPRRRFARVGQAEIRVARSLQHVFLEGRGAEIPG